MSKDSKYAQSKLEGEKNILNNFSVATILRLSVIFSSSDNFSCNLMTFLSRLPLFQFIILLKQNLFNSLLRLS